MGIYVADELKSKRPKTLSEAILMADSLDNGKLSSNININYAKEINGVKQFNPKYKGNNSRYRFHQNVAKHKKPTAPPPPYNAKSRKFQGN